MKRPHPSRSSAGKKSADPSNGTSTASTETSNASIEPSTEAPEAPDAEDQLLKSPEGSAGIESIDPHDNSFFIQYHPELAEKLSQHNSNYSVSGRCLSLVFNRMLYWSKYAKHRYEGKLYYWKNQTEISNETGYSIKQINRALKVLVELGLLVRKKFQKHFYRQVYFYHLPLSPHTQELKRQPARNRSTSTSSSTWRNSQRHSQQFHRSTSVPAPAKTPAAPETRVSPGATGGAGASVSAPPVAFPMDRSRRSLTMQTKCPNQSPELPIIIKHTLLSIMDRCNELGGLARKPETE